MNLTPSQHAELADASRQQFGATLSPEQRLLLVNLAAHHATKADQHKAAWMRFRTLGDSSMAQHEAAWAVTHRNYADLLDEWIAQ